MKKSVQVIYHNGQKILYSDFSCLEGYDLGIYIQSHFKQHQILFDASAETYLFLTNMSDTFIDREAMQMLKETTILKRPYTSRSAVFGLSGIQTVLYKAINVHSAVDARVFDSKEPALDWLVECVFLES